MFPIRRVGLRLGYLCAFSGEKAVASLRQSRRDGIAKNQSAGHAEVMLLSAIKEAKSEGRAGSVVG